jgi:leader peptidase (prepilin peptidase)/N-methyltransferase
MTPTLSELPHGLLLGFAVVLGLLFGSFLNVVIYRLPRGESLAFPGSRCPSCGKPIRAYDNLPVLSWLWLRGKARCCGAPITARYPLVELIGGLLAWAVLEWVVRDLPPDTAWFWALGVFALNLGLGLALVAVAFIDLEYMLIPDSLSVGGTLVGLVTAPWRAEQLPNSWLANQLVTALGLNPYGSMASLGDAVVGAVLGFVMIWLPFEVLYRALRGRPGMGRGDAKLTMLAGAWFGWPGAVFALLAGSVQGTLVAIAVYLTHGKIEEPEAVRQERAELQAAIEAADGEERRALEAELMADPVGREPESGLARARLSFGPFLVLATLEYLLFGPSILSEFLMFMMV